MDDVVTALSKTQIIKNAFAKLAGSAAGGFEEYTEQIITPLVENIAYAGQAGYNSIDNPFKLSTPEAWYNALVGSVSGGLFESAGLVPNGKKSNVDTNTDTKIERLASKNDDVQLKVDTISQGGAEAAVDAQGDGNADVSFNTQNDNSIQTDDSTNTSEQAESTPTKRLEKIKKQTLENVDNEVAYDENTLDQMDEADLRTIVNALTPANDLDMKNKNYTEEQIAKNREYVDQIKTKLELKSTIRNWQNDLGLRENVDGTRVDRNVSPVAEQSFSDDQNSDQISKQSQIDPTDATSPNNKTFTNDQISQMTVKQLLTEMKKLALDYTTSMKQKIADPARVENYVKSLLEETDIVKLQDHLKEMQGELANNTVLQDNGDDGTIKTDPSQKNYVEGRENIFDESGNLKPDNRYKTGEFDYFYVTDSLGRIKSFVTDLLQLTTRSNRLKHDSNTPGKLKGDQAGHIAGDRFGGSAN